MIRGGSPDIRHPIQGRPDSRPMPSGVYSEETAADIRVSRALKFLSGLRRTAGRETR